MSCRTVRSIRASSVIARNLAAYGLSPARARWTLGFEDGETRGLVIETPAYAIRVRIER